MCCFCIIINTVKFLGHSIVQDKHSINVTYYVVILILPHLPSYYNQTLKGLLTNFTTRQIRLSELLILLSLHFKKNQAL